MSSMAIKPQVQVLPEHLYRQQSAKIRTQMAVRADNPKTSIKVGKLTPRHDRDPAVKPEVVKTGETSRKRKRDQNDKGSKFALNCTMSNENIPSGKTFTRCTMAQDQSKAAKM